LNTNPKGELDAVRDDFSKRLERVYADQKAASRRDRKQAPNSQVAKANAGVDIAQMSSEKAKVIKDLQKKNKEVDTLSAKLKAMEGKLKQVEEALAASKEASKEVSRQQSRRNEGKGSGRDEERKLLQQELASCKQALIDAEAVRKAECKAAEK
jgi:septal ring factor EnvC (AmiA/AmiB activator)